MEIDVSISENERARETFYEQARSFLRKPREGIHVSDLLFPLRTYMRETHPEVGLPDRDCGFFLAGQAHHSIFQVISTLPEYREVEVEFGGIRGHIDMLHDVPVELKTTRMMRVRTGKEIARDCPHYIRQLAYYAAMTGRHRGQLWIFYLYAREKGSGRSAMTPQLRVYDVEFDDLDAIRSEMLERKDALVEALESGDPSNLPPCPKWMCRSCRFREHCGRGDDDGSER